MVVTPLLHNVSTKHNKLLKKALIKKLESVGMTLKKGKEQDGMMLAKVMEQDGMMLSLQM